jgi:hypothetical protein
MMPNMQLLLRAVWQLLLSTGCLRLLAVMAADSWLGCNAPMPRHPVIRAVAGLVLGVTIAALAQRKC